ncbi:MAG: NADH-quinone oxidoreductase subunit NuoG [Acidimicrobiia bacterium]
MTSIPISQWPSAHAYSMPKPKGPDTVTLTIDGKEVTAGNGDLLIKVAEEHGTYIPRFCYQERMKPVGMCRMCLVEVEGMRGFQISCATAVADGMVVHTQSESVKKVQDGILEFLLVNHPLDCPVCDRGGECPLQDQTLAFGPGESRFVEEKRHWDKPIPVSDLVMLDRERCIQCGRCTRFADEIAGDPLIDFGERGMHTEVITYPDEPFSSYFSGNTVQICPVGALTASPYRFRARPWDLRTVETSCTTCAVGCRGALQSDRDRLVRLLGVDSEPVNHGWLCDKGRFAYEHIVSDERVTEPMLRRDDALAPVTWPEALDAAVDGIRDVVDAHGATAVGVLGGAHGTNEDAYAWARFAKGVIGTDNVDAQLGDGLPAEVVLGIDRAQIADLDTAGTIVLAGPDVKEELPVLYLRIRRAVEDLGVPLVDLSSRDNGLTPYADAVVRHAPGELGSTAEQLVAAVSGQSPGGAVGDAAQLLRDASSPPVVVLGRASSAESSDSAVRAAAAFAGIEGTRFLSALHRGNVHGALDLGLTPGFLPGRVTTEAGASWFDAAWGTTPSDVGYDAEGILRAAVDGRIRCLVLLGADVLGDFPDGQLARDALAAVDWTVVVDAFESDNSRHADVFLPVALWGEKQGTSTNLEGRVQRLAHAVTPPGAVMEDWRIAAELALRFGVDVDMLDTDEVRDEISAVASAFRGADATLLATARDGVVLPARDHLDEIVHGPGRPATTSWDPLPSGSDAAPAADIPGEEAADHVPAEDEPAEEEGVDLPEPPPLYSWDADAPATDVAARDGYALRLISSRTLYDAGRVTATSPSLMALAADTVLCVHPTEADRLGVSTGERVRATSARGMAVLEILVDPATPPGTAFLAWNQPGEHGASELIGAGDPVTDLRVETLS